MGWTSEVLLTMNTELACFDAVYQFFKQKIVVPEA